MITERMTVGRSMYSNGGAIQFMQYAEGGIAIRVIADDGSVELTATVKMDRDPPDNDHVWLKTWGGNEGAATALALAGVVILTDQYQRAGMAMARLAKLTPAAIAQRDLECP